MHFKHQYEEVYREYMEHRKSLVSLVSHQRIEGKWCPCTLITLKCRLCPKMKQVQLKGHVGADTAE